MSKGVPGSHFERSRGAGELPGRLQQQLRGHSALPTATLGTPGNHFECSGSHLEQLRGGTESVFLGFNELARF